MRFPFTVLLKRSHSPTGGQEESLGMDRQKGGVVVFLMLSTAVADASEIKLVVMREVNNIVAGIVDSLQLLGFFEMGNRVKCDYMH